MRLFGKVGGSRRQERAGFLTFPFDGWGGSPIPANPFPEPGVVIILEIDSFADADPGLVIFLNVDTFATANPDLTVIL